MEQLKLNFNEEKINYDNYCEWCKKWMKKQHSDNNGNLSCYKKGYTWEF